MLLNSQFIQGSSLRMLTLSFSVLLWSIKELLIKGHVSLEAQWVVCGHGQLLPILIAFIWIKTDRSVTWLSTEEDFPVGSWKGQGTKEYQRMLLTYWNKSYPFSSFRMGIEILNSSECLAIATIWGLRYAKCLPYPSFHLHLLQKLGVLKLLIYL